MIRKLNLGNRLQSRAWPALGLLALLLGLVWLVWSVWEGPKTFRLTVTGGRLPGPKQRLAQVLARESTRRGVDLTLRECPGSIESLDEVNDGRVDLALVQGGLDSTRWINVRQVAALHVEPLQLVVRRELFEAVSTNIRALKGHSINLGEAGSGSEALARQVLGFVGLWPASEGTAGHYRAMFLSHRELQQMTIESKLPDAVLTVSSLPTPVVRHLVTTWGYRLVPIPFAEAFGLGDVDGDDGPTDINPSRLRATVDRVHIHQTKFPPSPTASTPPCLRHQCRP